MPNYSPEISLSQLKVVVNIMTCDNTDNSPFVIDMVVESLSNKFSLPLA